VGDDHLEGAGAWVHLKEGLYIQMVSSPNLFYHLI
jgi:hypothetical protein